MNIQIAINKLLNAGVNQNDIKEVTGYSQPYISLISTGKKTIKRPSHDMVVSLTKLLKKHKIRLD